jgi:hypothetical protein
MRTTARPRAALFLCLTALALSASAGGVQTQPSPDLQNAIRASCRSDFMAKCPGVPRGGKEALDCLQKNVTSLSPACKTAVSATIPNPCTGGSKTAPSRSTSRASSKSGGSAPASAAACRVPRDYPGTATAGSADASGSTQTSADHETGPGPGCARA